MDVSGLLREKLFERIPACVLTSATLTIAESFGYFRQRIGMEVGEELALSTEFDVRSQTMLYAPPRMPDYRHPSYLKRAVQEITNILNASRGRAFVLFTSYQQMMAAYEKVTQDLPWTGMDKSRGAGKSRLLEEFKVTPHAVLLRAVEPVSGITDTTHGPGLLCRALHIDRSLNGADLLGDALWLEKPTRYRAPSVARGPRIGVDYAGDWAKKPWRFFDKKSPYVSTVSAAARRKALKSA